MFIVYKCPVSNNSATYSQDYLHHFTVYRNIVNYVQLQLVYCEMWVKFAVLKMCLRWCCCCLFVDSLLGLWLALQQSCTVGTCFALKCVITLAVWFKILAFVLNLQNTNVDNFLFQVSVIHNHGTSWYEYLEYLFKLVALSD